MKKTYLLINGFIIIFPLAFTFIMKYKYYNHFPSLLFSILLTGCIFIVWDMIATHRKDWRFNPQYIIGIKFAGLPLEEILFFITVPYSCIFIYESLLYYFHDIVLPFHSLFYMIIAIVSIFFAFVYRAQYYTCTVLSFCALFLIIASLFFPFILKSLFYWLYLVISFILFFVFNYYLTTLPIVLYNPKAIWGIRITTIPLEDFFYNYAMLSMYLLVYLAFKNKIMCH